MNVIAISHSEDLDGIASAALVRMKFNVPESRVFYIDYSREQLLGVYRKLKGIDLANATLFITDLSVNDTKIDIYLKIIRLIRANKGKVVYLDHHPWSEKAVRAVGRRCDVAVNGEHPTCATEIVARHLQMKGKRLKELSRICHMSDYNVTAKTDSDRRLIKTCALGISYYNTKPPAAREKLLRALSSAIVEGTFPGNGIARAAEEFEAISKERIIAMLQNLRFIGKNIAVGFSKGLQQTYAANTIFRKANRDIAIYVNTDRGKASVRSINANITELARSFGGGGHPHAAGFEFSLKKYNVKTLKGRNLMVWRIEANAKRLGLLG